MTDIIVSDSSSRFTSVSKVLFCRRGETCIRAQSAAVLPRVSVRSINLEIIFLAGCSLVLIEVGISARGGSMVGGRGSLLCFLAL